MRTMQKKGMLSAPVRKLIFTKVDSQKNEPAETPGGILSPFKAAKSSQAGMDAIAESLCAATLAVEGFGFCLHDYDRYEPDSYARSRCDSRMESGHGGVSRPGTHLAGSPFSSPMGVVSRTPFRCTPGEHSVLRHST